MVVVKVVRLRRNVFANAENADRVNLSTIVFGCRNMIMYQFVGAITILINLIRLVTIIELL